MIAYARTRAARLGLDDNTAAGPRLQGACSKPFQGGALRRRTQQFVCDTLY